MRADARILIVRSGALGDIILALPMLRTLRRAYPKAYIAWVVESPYQDILRGNRDLDRLFVVDVGSFWRTSASLWRAIRSVRAEAFDLVIDLQGWIKSQLFCLVSGARAMSGVMKPNEVGFQILKNGVPFRPKVHMADLFLDVAQQLGAHEREISFEIPIAEQDRDHVNSFLTSPPLRRNQRVAVLQPGTTWENKRWSLSKLADVGRALIDDGFVPVVAWGPGELPEATEVARLIGNGARLAPPTTIRQLAALLAQSHLYVGTDSGPMHLASALGVPTVAVFGPSDPARFSPYRAPSRVVRRELACSPCEKRYCRLKTTECLQHLEPAEVVHAIRDLMSHSASTAASVESTTSRASRA